MSLGIMAGATLNEAQKVYTAITNAEAGPEQSRIDALEGAIASKDETIVSQAETIAKQTKIIESLQKRLSWFEWFKGCCIKE